MVGNYLLNQPNKARRPPRLEAARAECIDEKGAGLDHARRACLGHADHRAVGIDDQIKSVRM
jgi:hypothetical protein